MFIRQKYKHIFISFPLNTFEIQHTKVENQKDEENKKYIE